MFLAKITVTLKPTVNDPEGLTIRNSLHTIGLSAVEQVRSGKYIEVYLSSPNQEDAEEQIREMCTKLLVNPVIEEFHFALEDLP